MGSELAINDDKKISYLFNLEKNHDKWDPIWPISKQIFTEKINSKLCSKIWYLVIIHIDLIQIRPNSLKP